MPTAVLPEADCHMQAECRLGLDDRPELGDFGRLFRLYARNCPLEVCIQAFHRNVHSPMRLVGCADKVVQIPRIVELWREAKELEDRRLLCGRDGIANEMAMLATLRPRHGIFAGGAKFDAAVDFTISGSSNATESGPCILQVRDDAFMRESCQ